MDNLYKKINKLFENSVTRENDIYFYEKALDEYESDNRVKGVYAKALSLSNGDESKIKSKYLDLRVDLLKDDFSRLKSNLNNLEKSEIKDKKILYQLNKRREKEEVLNSEKEYFSEFSWGTFIFSFIYGIRYKVWSTFLVFIPYIGILIILFSTTYSARKTAWLKTDQDLETFKKENDNWDYRAQFIFVLLIISFVASALFLY